MTRAALLRKLRALEACDDAIVWLKSTDHATLQAAWDACERADWMLWLLVKLYPNERRGPIRHAVCDCAETALRYVPPGENRPRQAIAVARAYADGNATDADLAAAWAAAWDAVRDAARAAARAAAWAAAWDAAWDAARAAVWDAARAAARAAAWDAAWDAARAAAWDAAWDAARAAAGDAAGDAALEGMAALVRRRVPNPEAL